MRPLEVSLNKSETRFLLKGGDPAGGDKVNQVVATWPGWGRIAGARPGAVGSTYAGPCSTISALALTSTTLVLTWEESARARVSVLLLRFQKARHVLEGRLDLHTRPPPTARKPLPYQARGVAAIPLLDGRCWLADDMGLGKTAQALWAASELGASRVLVLCPSSVKFNWQNEVKATLGVTWPCQVIDGTPPQREKQFAQLSHLWMKHECLVIVINYDLLNHLTDDQLYRLQKFARDQMVIMDEGHALKKWNAGRTELVRTSFCAPNGGARWRVLVTGTPIRNTVEDVYSLAELVRPGTFFSKPWFLNRFTVQSTLRVGKRKQVTKKIVRRAKNTEELNLLLNTFQIRRKKEDVSDLPPKVFTYPELELDPHTAKVYAAMRDYALLLLEEHDESLPVLSPTCRTAVEEAARCEQIAQGCVGGVPEEILSSVSSVLTEHAVSVAGKPGWLIFPKSTKIRHLIEGLDTIKLQGGRAVVFSRFNAPLFWLQEHREQQGRAITGAMSAPQRQEIFNDFQAGDIQELYIQVRIAEGFNLHRAQDEFFLGRDWAPAVNAQAIDRCHRIGQKGTVNVQIPIVRGTIEVRQHQALQAKEHDAANALCFRTIGELKEALA